MDERSDGWTDSLIEVLLSIEKDFGNELDTGAHSVPSFASLLVSLDND